MFTGSVHRPRFRSELSATTSISGSAEINVRMPWRNSVWSSARSTRILAIVLYPIFGGPDLMVRSPKFSCGSTAAGTGNSATILVPDCCLRPPLAGLELRATLWISKLPPSNVTLSLIPANPKEFRFANASPTSKPTPIVFYKKPQYSIGGRYRNVYSRSLRMLSDVVKALLNQPVDNRLRPLRQPFQMGQVKLDPAWAVLPEPGLELTERRRQPKLIQHRWTQSANQPARLEYRPLGHLPEGSVRPFFQCEKLLGTCFSSISSCSRT